MEYEWVVIEKIQCSAYMHISEYPIHRDQVKYQLDQLVIARTHTHRLKHTPVISLTCIEMCAHGLWWIFGCFQLRAPNK